MRRSGLRSRPAITLRAPCCLRVEGHALELERRGPRRATHGTTPPAWLTTHKRIGPVLDSTPRRPAPERRNHALPYRLAAASGFAGWLGRGHGAGFSWDVAAATATAYGALALALVTWRLVASTRADAAGTLRLARLAEQEQEARLRPCVYPFANRYLRPIRVTIGDVGHLVVLPLQNGGQGLALNATGHTSWPAAPVSVGEDRPPSASGASGGRLGMP